MVEWLICWWPCAGGWVGTGTDISLVLPLHATGLTEHEYGKGSMSEYVVAVQGQAWGFGRGMTCWGSLSGPLIPA